MYFEPPVLLITGISVSRIRRVSNTPIIGGNIPKANGCFLCAPKERLIYYRNSPMFAMGGLGPIVDGYSIIAHEQHIRAMADIPESDVNSALPFFTHIRRGLFERFGSCVITEHGRMALCTDPAESSDDPHCYHAHLLAFPGAPNPVQYASTYFRQVTEFRALEDALALVRAGDEYFLFSPSEDSFFVMEGGLNVPRQFARQVMAISLKCPHLADWRRNPNWDRTLRIASDLRQQFQGSESDAPRS